MSVAEGDAFIDDDEDDEEDDDDDDDGNGSNSIQDERRTRGAARNVRQSKSSKASFGCAKTRFNMFCLHHLDEGDMDYLENDIVGDSLSATRPWSYDSLIKERIPYKLMDYFADYLSNHAKKLRGGNGATPIAYSTAMRYFSAIKEDISVGLSEAGKHNPALNKEAIARIYAGLHRAFKQRAYDENRNLVNPRKPLKLDDILTTAICCIWNGTYRYAAFFCYFLSLMQLAGRATEIAKIPWRNMDLIIPSEFEDQRESKIAEIELRRSKSYHMQGCSIFPHRNSFLQDWYFAMAYSMVLQQNQPSEDMFPLFASKSDEAEASIQQQPNPPKNGTESAKNKAVTQLYNNILRDLIAQSSNLAPDPIMDANAVEPPELQQRVAPNHVENFVIEPGIRSHGNKKWAVNKADEVYALKTTWVCFRVGWAMESAHTIFDYLVSNRRSDQQVGKALSGWTHQDVHGRLGGGYPPRLHPITSHVNGQSVDLFVESLFWRYDGAHWSRDFKRLLTASILMNLQRFIDLLLEHPHKAFGNSADGAWGRHMFLQELETAAERAAIGKTILLEWGSLVNKDFVERNVAFAPLQRVHEMNPQQPGVVDDRSLMSGVAAMADAIGANGIVTRELKDDWNSKSRNFVTQTQLKDALKIHEKRIVKAVVKRLGKEMRQAMAEMVAPTIGQGQVARNGTQSGSPATARLTAVDSEDSESEGDDEVMSTAEHNQTANASVLGIPQFFCNGAGGLKDFTIDGFFQDWHVNGHHKQIYRKGVNRHCRSNALLAIEYFTLFLPNHPLPLPPNVTCGTHPAAKNWRKELRVLIAVGTKHVRTFLKSHGKQYGKISTFKSLMFSVGPTEWPQGPAGSSHFQPTKVSKKGALEVVPLRTREQLVEHHTRQTAQSTLIRGRRAAAKNAAHNDDEDGGGDADA